MLAGDFFKLAEILRPMTADGHLGKDNYVAAQLLQRDVGAVAADDADLLQAFGPYEAWALAQANGASQLDIRTAPLALEVRKNLEVELVEGNGRAHR